MNRLTMILIVGTVAAAPALAGNHYNPGQDGMRKAGFDAFFVGKSPEQIAPYLAHPHPVGMMSAAKAMADRGDAAWPLTKKLLGDTHAGIRMGAIKVLYYRFSRPADAKILVKAPAAMQPMLTAVRPMAKDADPWVRNAVMGLVRDLRVESPEVNDMLITLAGDESISVRAAVSDLVCQRIKDPKTWVEVGILCNQATNASAAPTPADFRLLRAVRGHMECAREAVPVMIEFMAVHGQMLYGMWAERPKVTAALLMNAYPDDPRVRKALPLLVRRYAVQGPDSPYCGLREAMLQIGPDALPAIRAYVNAKDAHKQRVKNGREPGQIWPVLEISFDRRIRELTLLDQAIEFVSAATVEQVPAMVASYLSGPWSQSERGRLRMTMLKLGPAASPAIRGAIESGKAAASKQIAAELADVETRLAEKFEKVFGRNIEAELRRVNEQRAQLDRVTGELVRLAETIEMLGVENPTADQVQSLCRLYREHIDWEDTVYEPAKPGWTPAPLTQLPRPDLRLIRAKLLSCATPEALLAFVSSDQPHRNARTRYWAAREQFFRDHPSVRFGRGLDTVLVNLKFTRDDLTDAYRQLGDIATLGRLKGKLAAKAPTADLCRIYTRRDWPAGRDLIEAELRSRGRSVEAAVAKHIAAEAQYRKKVQAERETFYAYLGRSRFVWQHDRLKALGATIDDGVAGLAELVK